MRSQCVRRRGTYRASERCAGSKERKGAYRAREPCACSRHVSAAVRAQKSVQGKTALCVLKAREVQERGEHVSAAAGT